MARTRNLQVVISGDAKSLNKAFGQVDDSAAKADKRIGGLKKSFGLMGAAAGGAAVLGLKSSVSAAIDAEKSQAKLEAQLKAMNISYRAHAKEIDGVIQKTSQLAGLDDEDLQDAFTAVVRATGSVKTGMKDMALVADLARAKHMDVAKAGELVAKVHAGNVGPLKRLGLEFTKSTKNVDELKKANKDYTPEQLKAAKAADQQANSTRALGLLQDRVKGQAKAYGETTAGSVDRAKVAWENLQETLGAKLLPVVTKVGEKLVKVIEYLQNNGDQAKALGIAVGGLVTALGTALIVTKVAAGIKLMRDAMIAVNIALAANPIGLVVIAIAGLVTGLVIAYKKSETFRKIVDGAFSAIKTAAKATIGWILTGIDKWMGAYSTLASAAGKLPGPLGAPFRAAAKAIDGARQHVRDLRDEINGLPSKKKTQITVQVKFAGQTFNLGSDDLLTSKPQGDGIGVSRSINAAVRTIANRGASSGALAPAPIPGGGMGEGLMGAQQALSPFAAIGSKFGLRVSSGRRTGSITSSGNVSYHSTGEAIDEAGSPTGMMGFFRYMKSKFGSRLAELIYTPGGAGIKNGQPYTYGGQVAADHYDHVHVALDTGAPGVGDGYGRSGGPVGDGLGKFIATSYGPPWGGIQGQGVTATGVDLTKAPHTYGIAVDPSKLSLGQSYYVTPNPFGYKGAFKAFDTGGAIKGNRIDFYDWRGRKSQNGWGRRAVQLSTTAPGATSGTKTGGSSGLPFKVTSSAAQGAGSIGVGAGAGFVPGMGSVSGTGAVTEYGSGFSAEDTGAAVADSPTFDDMLSAEAANASLTSGLGDDLTAASRKLDDRRLRYGNAVAGGDPRVIAQAAEDLRAASENFNSIADQIKQEKVDWANADLALAQLTDTLDDDKAALEKKKALDEQALAEAKASNDPRKIAEAASNLKSDTDALKSLKESVDAANDIAKARLELDQQLVDNQRAILRLADQGPQILAAVVAAVSGGIGGQAGLGFQSVGYAGQVARY